MKKILILIDHFLPGNKAGGPVKTIFNLISRLSDDYIFYIFTSDKDLGDKFSYKNIQLNRWIKFENYNIFYSKIVFKVIYLFHYIHFFKIDLIYLNSFFSYKSTLNILLLLSIGVFRDKKILIAPRGEFSDGALSLKSYKKKLYLKVIKLLKIPSYLVFHASTELESLDIKKIFGDGTKVLIANDLADLPLYTLSEVERNHSNRSQKILSMVFLSRISRMKNLDFVLKILGKTRTFINLDIYGPIEDVIYWNECKLIISNLPENVKVKYWDSVDPTDVQIVFSHYDVFFFPTRGENFGHVIIESLLAGCPVLLSDTTPWNSIHESGCGWNISLFEEQKFIDTIESFCNYENEDFLNMIRASYYYGVKLISNEESYNNNIRLFEDLFEE